MVELIGQTAALQRSAQTAVVKSEQTANSAQTAKPDTEITLRYPTDQVEISEEGLAQAAQQKGGAAMHGGTAPAGDAGVSKGAKTASADAVNAGAQTAQGTQTAQSAQSAESRELESAKRTIAQMKTAEETEESGETQAEESAAQSTSNLGNLTEQQLETLVKQGAITRAQADNELASRAGAEE